MVLWQVANEGTLGADNMGSYIVLPSCLVSPLSQWWLKMLEVILDGGSLFVTDGTLQAISSVRHSDNLEQSGTTWQKSRSGSSWSRNVFTELQLELETAAKKNSDEKKNDGLESFFGMLTFEKSETSVARLTTELQSSWSNSLKKTDKKCQTQIRNFVSGGWRWIQKVSVDNEPKILMHSNEKRTDWE